MPYGKGGITTFLKVVLRLNMSKTHETSSTLLETREIQMKTTLKYYFELSELVQN